MSKTTIPAQETSTSQLQPLSESGDHPLKRLTGKKGGTSRSRAASTMPGTTKEFTALRDAKETKAAKKLEKTAQAEQAAEASNAASTVDDKKPHRRSAEKSTSLIGIEENSAQVATTKVPRRSSMPIVVSLAAHGDSSLSMVGLDSERSELHGLSFTPRKKKIAEEGKHRATQSSELTRGIPKGQSYGTFSSPTAEPKSPSGKKSETTTTSTLTLTTPTSINPSKSATSSNKVKVASVSERGQAREDLKDGTIVLKRAALRDKLIEAVNTGNADLVDAVFKELPPQLRSLEKYLPKPMPGAIDRRLVELAQQLPLRPWSDRLIQYIQQTEYATQGSRVLQKQLPENSDSLNAFSKIKELCKAMRDGPEADIQHQVKTFEQLIQKALKRSNLAEELALQPFVSNKKILQQCAVLAVVAPSANLQKFLATVEKARKMQTNSGDELTALLRSDRLSENELRRLAKLQYAFSYTGRPASYVARDAKPSELTLMVSKLDHCLGSKGSKRFTTHERAAIQYVRDKLENNIERTKAADDSLEEGMD